jgi:aryl-alcohol dehydrogenase-like predicted oxidoreductase
LFSATASLPAGAERAECLWSSPTVTPSSLAIALSSGCAQSHPAITSPRTIEHLETQLAAAEVVLSDDVLDRIEEIVPPGTTINPADSSFNNPALERAARWR